MLEKKTRTHGLHNDIATDKGTEFTCLVVDEWAHRNGVKLDFIRSGKPIEKAYIESFNGRLRHECEAWRIDYNEHRPHSALNDQKPSEFAENFDLFRAVEKAGF